MVKREKLKIKIWKKISSFIILSCNTWFSKNFKLKKFKSLKNHQDKNSTNVYILKQLHFLHYFKLILYLKKKIDVKNLINRNAHDKLPCIEYSLIMYKCTSVFKYNTIIYSVLLLQTIVPIIFILIILFLKLYMNQLVKYKIFIDYNIVRFLTLLFIYFITLIYNYYKKRVNNKLIDLNH